MKEVPHNLEAERAVLGGVLIRPSSYDDAAAELVADDFFLPAHRVIFEAMADLRRAGRPLDPLEVAEATRARGGHTGVNGGDGYLMTLAASVPTAENTPHYVRLVRERATLRRLIATAVEIQSRAAAPDAASDEILAEARTAIADLDSRGGGGPVRVGDALGGVFDEISAKASGAASAGSVATGIGAYDRVIGKWPRQHLIVVAARPGIGKTAFAGGVALRAALRGEPSLIFSLEMSLQEMSERMIGASARFTVEKLSRGAVEYAEFRKVFGDAGVKRLGGAPLWVDDRVLTIGQITAVARSWRARNASRAALVVIDYLGLIRASSKEKRTEEVGRMAWASKVLAKELDCPVALVSQLNRDSEKEKRRPILSDLRDSGEIEQHANTVIFPWREPPLDESGPATLIVAKNRGGRTGEIDCYWHAEFMTFEGREENDANVEIG